MSRSTSKLPPLARQWRIVKLLSAARGLSLNELAAELGVSIKSIRRDLGELRDADIPLAESTGPHGKKTWRLDMGERIPTSFNFDEIAALYFGRLTSNAWPERRCGPRPTRRFAKSSNVLGRPVWRISIS